MLGGGGQEDTIPIISIECPSDSPSHSHHALSSGLLSPHSPTHGPPSPLPSDLPPSPTLSNHSIHFPSTLQLRDNKPEENPGRSSLHVLNPDSFSHHRQGSASTSLTDVARSDDVHHSHSNTTSLTKVDHSPHSPTLAIDDIEEDDLQTARQTELAQDAAIDPAPFRFKPYELAHMLDPKSIETLVGFGGIDGLLRGLGTNPDTGLVTNTEYVQSSESSHKSNGADDLVFSATIEDRRRVYGENVLPTRNTKTLLQLMWAALKDKVLILLSIAAVISLALGLFRDFGPARDPEQPPVDWVEGVAIMVAIAIIVIVGSLNDWQKERQFKALNDRKEERGLKVIRDGVEKVIDIKEVVVGDIALLEPGEIVPCDGVFISGHNVKCDESGATGESDPIKKVSFSEIVEDHAHEDCFIISGSKVLEGVGSYVIVAVGSKSFNGRIMMALRGDTENTCTPLQVKLNNLANIIMKLGSAAAGLPLAVILTMAFATKRMVRSLGSYDTIGTNDGPALKTPNAGSKWIPFGRLNYIVAVGQALTDFVKLYILYAMHTILYFGMSWLENGQRSLVNTFRQFTSGFSSQGHSSRKDWTSSGNPKPDDILNVAGAWKDINWFMENISLAVQNGHNDRLFLRLIVERSDSLWDRFINMPYRASPFIRKSIEDYRLILFDVNEAIHSHPSISPNKMDEFDVRLKEFERDLVAMQFEHMRPPDNPSQHQSFHMFKDARNLVITGGKFIQSGPSDRYDRQLAKMMYMHYLTLGVLFG